MAESQESLDEGDSKGHFELDGRGKSGSTVDVAQTRSTSGPPELKDVLEEGIGDPHGVTQQLQEPAKKAGMWDKKFVAFFVLSALAALVLSVIVARGRYLAARRETPKLAYTIPTDKKGLRETVELVEKNAKRLRSKWNSSSAEVRAAYMKLYSPKLFVETFTEKQNRLWRDKCLEAIRSQSLPGWAAGKTERQEFALRSILVATVFRVAEMRLDLLGGLEELAMKHRIPSIFSMDAESPPLQLTEEDKANTVSFQQFIRRLEKLGLTGVAQEGDSGLRVTSVLADDLASAVEVKMRYDASNAAVIQEFEKFLASVQQATIGKSESKAQRIENIVMPDTKVPFPVRILAQAVKRAEVRRGIGQLSSSQIQEWSGKARWNDAGVSAAAKDLRGSQQAFFDLALYGKQSDLRQWGHLEDINSFPTHLFTHAIALL
ncbi:uncharacterized protein EMH_0020950 [Eimeria mitis]|uniref:Transmembrane protein n=1 Tax=Eimeria mitis TaxID=44415 RepID=U6KE86_9EIME|nr:uncharacterized protein EMH_0020950 [Eimeria mitis]CDJ34552.1 hypothetical protein, conserved [Eimeria mitis]